MFSSSLRACLGHRVTRMCVSPALITGHRTFWNPFAGRATAASESSTTATSTAASAGPQTTVTRVMTEANRTLDQHNERLVGACLDLLDLCDKLGPSVTPDAGRGRAQEGMEPVELETVVELVHVVLHDFRTSPSRQFDLVYGALCLPVASANRSVQRCLMVVLESVVPAPLYRLFESQSLVLSGEDSESRVRRDVLKTFAHALLGELNTPEGVEDEEYLLVIVDDFKQAFPAVVSAPVFVALEADAEKLALQAKLFVLLGRLCAEFDTDNDGKVYLSELRDTADRVLGKDKAAQLLEGAVCDTEGRIPFNQLTALLTRPPPARSTSARAKEAEKQQ